MRLASASTEKQTFRSIDSYTSFVSSVVKQTLQEGVVDISVFLDYFKGKEKGTHFYLILEVYYRQTG